jgi:hypothetical protein
VQVIEDILDTPAKQTLWFHIIPLLDEDDQEYAKRKIRLTQSRESLFLNENLNERNVQYQMNPNTSKRTEGISGVQFSPSKHEYDYLSDGEIDHLFDLTSHDISGRVFFIDVLKIILIKAIFIFFLFTIKQDNLSFRSRFSVIYNFYTLY